jgi:hypothetical protein
MVPNTDNVATAPASPPVHLQINWVPEYIGWLGRSVLSALPVYVAEINEEALALMPWYKNASGTLMPVLVETAAVEGNQTTPGTLGPTLTVPLPDPFKVTLAYASNGTVRLMAWHAGRRPGQAPH